MLFSKEMLRNYAQSKNLDIDDDALLVLSQDLEYRTKELCQEAAKFMLFSKRSKLQISDINNALKTRNVDPLLGYDPRDNLIFKSFKNSYFYVPDEEIDIDEYLEQPPPKLPIAPVIQSHWLAIEGVQPQVPQNPLSKIEKISKNKMNYQEDLEFRDNTKHILSKELQLYYEKIIDSLNTSSCAYLEFESGIQQLVPYFIHYFNENIVKSLEQDFVVTNVLEAYLALLKNKYIFVDPYLHQIVPTILTCVVGKNVKNRNVRELASGIVAFIYESFGSKFTTLAPRILNTLAKTYSDELKTEDQHFGAVYCLSKLPKCAQKVTLEKTPYCGVYNEIEKMVIEMISE
ncbi:Transcription initiation factor TFIID subunit 6 [Dictyocoela muelleri]|nr:Transcription initiation factor TFIID subunit 6 [Dictyocoela muelleri]